MDTLVIDLESYFDPKYSLKKLPTLTYIRDPRFQLHGLAAKHNSQPAEWISARWVSEYLHAVDWKSTALITHNSHFDNIVLYEHYAITPAQRIDTLALCRMALPHDLDFDLDSICYALQLPSKVGGGKALEAVKGLRELPPQLEADLAKYAIGDAESTYGLYETLYPLLPEKELRAMNLLVRMATEGVIELDPDMLKEAEQEIIEERRTKLEAVSATPEQLRSRDQFAALLKAQGVEPPTKISPTTSERTWAFSKQDPEFIALLTNEKARDLVNARMAWASNNAVSRIKTYQTIQASAPHTLPMQINASGAHTHRITGGSKTNTLNLNRGSKLRLAVVAPKGHVICVADSSQIELRTNAWQSGQMDVLEQLQHGEDPYIKEAAAQFGIPEEEVTGKQRNFGKVIRLACGYQQGGPRFRLLCAAGPMGNPPIYLTQEEADAAIRIYRKGSKHIVAHWRWLQTEGLPLMLRKKSRYEHKCFTFEYQSIRLPGGLYLRYPHLQQTEDEQWVWGINGVTHFAYGGIIAENCSQALAGEIIRYQMLEIEDELNGLGRVVHQVYDEILVVCPEKDADDVTSLMKDIMRRSPSYAPDLPLDCKVDYAWRYSK